MISFIGAGKVGSALGVYFKQKGQQIAGYYSRNHQHAFDASRLTDSTAFADIEELLMQSSMVWITVTDDALGLVAEEIAKLEIPNHIKAFIHTSGVHSSNALKAIENKGYATYSAHPLMAFGSIDESVMQLNDVYFSMDTHANQECNDYLSVFFENIGNKTLSINSEKKELYHCAASVLSNYLVTLVNMSYEMFEAAGMSRSDIKKATAPLLQSTLKNIAEHDTMKDALTGPIKRGDKTTIIKHLKAIEKYMPSKSALYNELGKGTMEMLHDYELKSIFS